MSLACYPAPYRLPPRLMKRVTCELCWKKVPYKHFADHQKKHGAEPKKRGRPKVQKAKTTQGEADQQTRPTLQTQHSGEQAGQHSGTTTELIVEAAPSDDRRFANVHVGQLPDQARHPKKALRRRKDALPKRSRPEAKRTSSGSDQSEYYIAGLPSPVGSASDEE